jgi:hypothetical protein
MSIIYFVFFVVISDKQKEASSPKKQKVSIDVAEEDSSNDSDNLQSEPSDATSESLGKDRINFGSALLKCSS